MSVLTDDDGNLYARQACRATQINTAVDGAHCVMTFQCELCWVRNLAGRDLSLPRDRMLQQCIRRANLDAFHGRAKGTIDSHVGGVKSIVQWSAVLNKPPSLSQTPRGPMMVGDPVGMSLAVEMLYHSVIGKGRNAPHIQFDTMRKSRSTFTRSWDSSPLGVIEGSTFTKGLTRARTTSCPTQSNWFSDFLIGSEDRMGYDTKRQEALPIKTIVLMLQLVKRDADEKDDKYADCLYKFGALVAILTAGSLRGYEGFFLDLAGTRGHISSGQLGCIPKNFRSRPLLTEEEIDRLPSVCICLLGKFKGETGERYHSIVLANTTTSGIETRWWVERLLMVCEEEGRTSGFAFYEPDGSPPNSTEYNALFRQYLCRMQRDHPEVFSRKEDVTRYGISRTPRRSAVTRAERAGLAEDVVNSVNRWRTIENAKNTRPRHNMRTHYMDARGLAPMTWRYSYAL